MGDLTEVRSGRIATAEWHAADRDLLRPVHLNQHRPVCEAEGLSSHLVVGDELDAASHPALGSADLGDDPTSRVLQRGWIILALLEIGDPLCVAVHEPGG